MKKNLKNLLKTEIDPGFAKRAEFIFQAIEEQKPLRILDVGCGRGFYLKALSLYRFLKEIHGVDINTSYLTYAKKLSRDRRVVINKASIYHLPYPNNHFDSIICTEVLEHLTDDLQGLLELRRVLKRNGLILITVPHSSFPFMWDPVNWILMRFFHTHVNKNIWWLAGIWADHERLYKESDIKELTRKANLKIISVKRAIRYCLPFSHFLIYGLGKNLIERLNLYQLSRFGERQNMFTKAVATIFQFPSRCESLNSVSSTSTNLMFRIKKL